MQGLLRPEEDKDAEAEASYHKGDAEHVEGVENLDF